MIERTLEVERDSMHATREMIARINASASDGTSKVTHEGDHPFASETVRRYTLDNGLKVLLLVDASAPVVSYFTWYGVGSRHEKPGKTGLAHLFEHLMFNETENLKAGEFDRKLEENGAESNAATWVDWTYYYEALPADRLSLAIELESDRMTRLVLREPQVTSEKEVVANERRYRVDDDVEGAASELLYKLAFTKHPYQWPTIGWMADIEGFTPADCEAFYRTYYAPNNALVVIVGDFEEESTLRMLQAAYGAHARAVLPPEDTEPEPPQIEERILEIKKPTATDKFFVAYHGPALGDADHSVLTLMNEVLCGGRASRLHRALVIDAEIASELRGWVGTFRDPGLYEISASARAGHTAAELQEIIDRELMRLRSDVVTDDELERAKARLELSVLQSLESTSGKAEQIGFYETVVGDPAAAFRRLEAYRRVTPSDVRRAARRFLAPSSRSIVRVFPDGEAIDDGEDNEAAE
jgi:zinc protease